MPVPFLRGLASAESRTALFYFVLFSMSGAMGAYFGIWLDDKGLSAGEIGWINSAPIFLTLLFNIYVGRLADRAPDWRNVIIIGSVVSFVLTIGLFFAEGFWGLLIVFTIMTIPFSLVLPVFDAAAIRLTRRNGTSFAKVRALGTVGYVAALWLTAYAAGHFGGQIYLYIVFAIAAARAGFSFLLPRFRAGVKTLANTATSIAVSGKLADVLKPWFIAPIVAFAIVQGLHFILGAFSGVIWRANGIPESLVGPLLALGSMAEIVAMLAFKRVASRYTARHLILVAMIVSALRWAGMAFNPPLVVLALLQLTHAVTFGIAYLGLMNFIANWTSEDIAAEAQSFANVIQMSVVVLSLSSFGYLVDWFGNYAFAAGTVSSIIAAGCVAYSLHVRPAADTKPD